MQMMVKKPDFNLPSRPLYHTTFCPSDNPVQTPIFLMLCDEETGDLQPRHVEKSPNGNQ